MTARDLNARVNLFRIEVVAYVYRIKGKGSFFSFFSCFLCLVHMREAANTYRDSLRGAILVFPRYAPA